MVGRSDGELSRRERQIMDVIYRKGEASVSDVRADLPAPPSYSAVRALMRILEDKGYLRHRRQGTKYVYLPRQSRRAASRSALRRVLRTFFHGSVERVVAALLNDADTELSPDELDRLSHLIREAKQREAQS